MCQASNNDSVYTVNVCKINSKNMHGSKPCRLETSPKCKNILGEAKEHYEIRE